MCGNKNPHIPIQMASPREGPYLHRPEVKGQEEEHCDKAAHEALAEPITAHIGDNGTHSEEQVEERGQRMPRGQPRGTLTPGAKRKVVKLWFQPLCVAFGVLSKLLGREHPRPHSKS
jgi:hypothetical protein